MLEKLLDDVDYCIKIVEIENFTVDELFFKDYLDTENEKYNEKYEENILEIWKTIYENNKIKPTWNNILTYIQFLNIDEILYNFMKENSSILKNQKIDNISDDVIKTIIEYFNKKEDIDICNDLIPILRMKNFNIDINTLEYKILQIMIDINYFDFTIPYLNSLIAIDSEYDLIINYIVQNQEKFIDEIIGYETTISTNILFKLLDHNKINTSIKSSLLNIYVYIYASEKFINYILQNSKGIKVETVIQVLQYANEKEKLHLLNIFINKSTNNQIEIFFNQLDKPYHNLANRNKKHTVQIENNKDNLLIANTLKEKGYIHGYKFTKKNTIISCNIKQKK